MAVKDVKEYYEQVCAQYIEMQHELADFQKEVEDGIVEPERLDTIKQVIEPIKNNYMTLSWIMFLLNKPQRKSKEKRYLGMSKKFTDSLDTKFSKDAIVNGNKEVLNRLGEV